MSKILKSLNEQLIVSMKNNDSVRKTVIRLAKSDIKKKEIDSKKELQDSDVVGVLMSLKKQISESLEQAKSAGREDSVSEYENQIKVIVEFLPEQLSEADVNTKVAQIVNTLKSGGSLPDGPSAMGVIMRSVMEELKGKADGKVIQSAVKSAL